jgi:predicted MPP superfamily phosphohydrolase
MNVTSQSLTGAEKAQQQEVPGYLRPDWIRERKILEQKVRKRKIKLTPYGQYLSPIDVPIFAFGIFLKLTGLYQKGYRNARAIQLRQHTLFFEGLPEAFDGYKILHLTDLHLDTIPGIEYDIVKAFRHEHYDLCVITGDYRKYTQGQYLHVLPPLSRITEQIFARDGIFATLGNHDTWQMASHLQMAGLHMLVNESVTIRRGDASIALTGTDDPHYYYTPAITDAFQASGSGFKIALVHAPECYEEAARNGYALYLAGHTHGGQIALPGGKPIISNLRKGTFSSGLWQYKGMQGYTSQGCGVSAIPIRFNTQGEVTLFTLRKKA